MANPASYRQNIDRIPIRQIERSEKLDESMQAMTVAFKASDASFKNVVNITSEERTLTKQYINDHLQRQDELRLQEKFMDGLHFPEILSREERIKDAHKKTFQWIFDETGKSMRPWSNFVEWLREGSRTYWINGKPGSGKSTLMNYIRQDPRTRRHLIDWAGTKELLTPAFFFWASGSALQRSTEGFLRSMLYQILFSHHELIPLIQREEEEAQTSVNPLIAWTEKRLLQKLKIAAREVSKFCRICFFIDGLDEFAGDYHRLIDLIKLIVDNSEIKCCFSSRPEKAFNNEFSFSHTMRLQDLTRDDIEVFVDAELDNFRQVRDLPAKLEWERRCLRNKIVDKADGVFLWVELVVKSQVVGIRNEDSLKILQERFDSLPTEVEGLYSRMLSRIDKLYYREAAWYLHFALIAHGYTWREGMRGLEYFMSNICAFTIAKVGLTRQLRLNDCLTPSNFARRCFETHNRLLLTCAGLLEVEVGTCVANRAERIEFLGTWQRWKPEGVNLVYEGVNWAYAHVGFCHRTVLDFFMDGNDWLLSEEYAPFPEHWLLPPAISLARMTLSKSDDPQKYVFDHVGYIMSFAANCEPGTEDKLHSAIQLMDYVDGVVGDFCERQHVVQDANQWPHWWFEELRSMCPPNVSKAPTLDLPRLRSLRDFIDIATLFSVFWYTRQALHKAAGSPSTATRLALLTALAPYRDRTWTHTCVSTRSDVVRRYKSRCWGIDWSVRYWSQVDMLTELVSLGADPNAGEGKTLWQQALNFMYEQKYTAYGPLIDENRLDNEFARVTNAFLEVGADAKAAVTGEWAYNFRNGFKVQFDRSWVPLIASDRREETYVALEDGSPMDGIMTHANPNLRLQLYLMTCEYDHFRDSDNPSICALWSTDGIVASDAQTLTFCSRLRTMLDATRHDKLDLDRDMERWLMDEFIDGCEQYQEDADHDCPDYPLDPASDDEDSGTLCPLTSRRRFATSNKPVPLIVPPGFADNFPDKK